MCLPLHLPRGVFIEVSTVKGLTLHAELVRPCRRRSPSEWDMMDLPELKVCFNS
jgi:hypothetical protein